MTRTTMLDSLFLARNIAYELQSSMMERWSFFCLKKKMDVELICVFARLVIFTVYRHLCNSTAKMANGGGGRTE